MPRLNHDTEGRGHRFDISVRLCRGPLANVQDLRPRPVLSPGATAQEQTSLPDFPISGIDTQTNNDGGSGAIHAIWRWEKIMPGQRPHWSASAVGGEETEGNIHGRIGY